MPEKIELFDTTLRDGTQGEGVTLSARDKLRLTQAMDELGVDIIEGGWPGSNPKDRTFFQEARKLNLHHAQLCAFGSTRRAQFSPEEDPNLQALLEAETPVVSIFGKSWKLHAEKALGITPEENLALIRSSVVYLKAHGRRVIYDAEHFFDGYRDDPAYALATLRAAADAGADVLVLCDTNGGSLPHEVYDIVHTVRHAFDLPLGIHTHNDTGCAVANTLMAVRAGARHVQGTFNGVGERCGNADLCAVIPNLQLKMGFSVLPEDKLVRLTEISRMVYELAGLPPLERAPYVGRSAFAHKGGIHVSAILKHPATYEHIPPETVGNTRRVLVSDLSGQSNVRYKLQELNLGQLDPETTRQIVQEIKELEHQGYAFESAEASFELLVRRKMGQALEYFVLERFRVFSQAGVDNRSEALTVVRVGPHREMTAAEGQGPVDALSQALRQALLNFYPSLTKIRLTDYKVAVVHPADGTAAQVRVYIEHGDGILRWRTLGVSHNILEASARALTEGLRYALYRQGVQPAETLQEAPA